MRHASPAQLVRRTALGFNYPMPSVTGHVRRWVLAGAGVLCVVLAAIGAVLPGLPTTIFLILASYFFARSCPWLEERLMRNRLFAPYLAWIDGRERMPRRVKAGAIASLWLAVGTSLVLLHLASALPAWLAAIVLVAAVAGTFAIALDAAARLAGARDERSA